MHNAQHASLCLPLRRAQKSHMEEKNCRRFRDQTFYPTILREGARTSSFK